MSGVAGTAAMRPAGTISTRALADRALWFVVFLGGFVIVEPAPYELFLVAAIPIYFLGGLKLRASFSALVTLLLVYMVGGMLSVTQVRPSLIFDGVIYMAVSLFLCLSAIWFAALIAEDWRRIRIIEQAYIATAVLVALLGIAGYFRLVPAADLFLLYGRAKGTFQDPNVFGPFLALPSLILARRLMTGPLLTQPFTLIGLGILIIGILLSFSRAAWGLIAVAIPLLAAFVAANASSNRQRLRLIGLATLGIAAIVVLIAVALSIPAVSQLLVERAQLVQSYDGKDGAELGRFARHWVGFQMATEMPLGIGPNEFPMLYIEATHNSYLKALMEYGWLGFVAYMILVVMTIAKAMPLVFQPRPWQGFAQCLVACFLVHLVVGWLIDTDHWRHFYMMIGLIWGLVAAERLHRGNRPMPRVIREAAPVPAGSLRLPRFLAR